MGRSKTVEEGTMSYVSGISPVSLKTVSDYLWTPQYWAMCMVLFRAAWWESAMRWAGQESSDRWEVSKIKGRWDFPVGPVVNNLPRNAGDTSSTPGQGTKIPQDKSQLESECRHKERSWMPQLRLVVVKKKKKKKNKIKGGGLQEWFPVSVVRNPRRSGPVVGVSGQQSFPGSETLLPKILL